MLDTHFGILSRANSENVSQRLFSDSARWIMFRVCPTLKSKNWHLSTRIYQGYNSHNNINSQVLLCVAKSDILEVKVRKFPGYGYDLEDILRSLHKIRSDLATSMATMHENGCQVSAKEAVTRWTATGIYGTLYILFLKM